MTMFTVCRLVPSVYRVGTTPGPRCTENGEMTRRCVMPFLAALRLSEKYDLRTTVYGVLCTVVGTRGYYARDGSPGRQTSTVY